MTAYNAWDQPLFTLDADRVQSSQTYDSFGRVLTKSRTSTPTLTHTYTSLDKIDTVGWPAIGSNPASLMDYNYSSANGSLLTSLSDRAGNITTVSYAADFQVATTQTSLNAGTGLKKTTNYDTYGRKVGTLDEANARTASTYDILDRKSADHQADHPFDANGNPTASTVGVAFTAYTQYSQILSTTGAGTYPIRYAYDLAGNMTDMTDGKGTSAATGWDQTATFATGAVTHWALDVRNRLARKYYGYINATTFTSYDEYSYESNGLLKTKRDGKGQTATNFFEPSRNLLLKTDFPTNTDIIYGTSLAGGVIAPGYDKARRLTRFEDETGVSTMTFDALGRLQKSTQASVNHEIIREYDAWSRLSLTRYRPIGAANAAATEWTVETTYDAAGRTRSLKDSNVATTPFTYAYLANADLIDTLTAPSGLVQDKNYDPRGLLSSITTRDNASAVLRNFIYGLNSLSQRTTITREDSAVLAIGYDARRQVISGQKTTAGTSFPAYDFRYAFDEMGNRKSAGSTAQPTATTYATNPLNQYTAVTQASLSLNPTVDLNGSTLNDGRTVSTWNERNQRRSVTQTSTGEQLFCKFDAVGRRTEEQELGATNNELRKTRYLYDGWNCVAEFAVTPVTAALVGKKTHTWGLDLSQTPQGAGGVGGLLATVDETATKAIYTAAYDGNGNVAALYTNSFSPAASYEYDPFGKTLSASGAYAVENKYRFSTKPQDRIGGLYYFGYRYYDPVTGRWPNRDPIEEEGGRQSLWLRVECSNGCCRCARVESLHDMQPLHREFWPDTMYCI